MPCTWYEMHKEQPMTKEILSHVRAPLAATLCLAVLVCGAYPFAVWAIAQGLFPDQANGSLIQNSGHIRGSALLAQPFTGPAYFHPRPSAAGKGYDAANSGGSNLGPTSQKLIDTIKERIAAYRTLNHVAPNVPIPADAVTASASGLDPHISLQNAILQAPRVAAARHLGEAAIREAITRHTEGRDLGILGESRVNVLLLNLSLDRERRNR